MLFAPRRLPHRRAAAARPSGENTFKFNHRHLGRRAALRNYCGLLPSVCVRGTTKTTIPWDAIANKVPTIFFVIVSRFVADQISWNYQQSDDTKKNPRKVGEIETGDGGPPLSGIFQTESTCPKNRRRSANADHSARPTDFS